MNRFYMICFDIANERRLRKVSDELENFGQRVQRSIFECWLDESTLFELKRRLADTLDDENDSVRYYPLCASDTKDIQIDGPGSVTHDLDYAVF